MATRLYRELVSQASWGSKSLRVLTDYVVQGQEAWAILLINSDMSKPIDLVQGIMGRPLTRSERDLYVQCPEHIKDARLAVAMQYGHYWEDIVKAVRAYLNPACRARMPKELAHADIVSKLRLFSDSIRSLEVKVQ